jgi:hypothetical protein
MARAKAFARWLGVFFSLAAIGFAILSYRGFWNDEAAQAVAARFDLSYAADAAKEVRAGDPEWPSTGSGESKQISIPSGERLSLDSCPPASAPF